MISSSTSLLSFERRQFPQSRSPILDQEDYDQAAERLSNSQTVEAKNHVLLHTTSAARGAYHAFERHQLLQAGAKPSEADIIASRTFDRFGESALRRLDGPAALSIETASRAVEYHDEPYLKFTQEHVFKLGTNWRIRAYLGEYLFPFKTGKQPVSTPRDRIAHVLTADYPALYVKQTILDLYSARHLRKPYQGGGRVIHQLSALDELLMRQTCKTSFHWRVEVDWVEVATLLDHRTAHVLAQLLAGRTVAEIGKTNYNYFRRQFPRIRQAVLSCQHRRLSFH